MWRIAWATRKKKSTFESSLLITKKKMKKRAEGNVQQIETHALQAG